MKLPLLRGQRNGRNFIKIRLIKDGRDDHENADFGMSEMSCNIRE